MPTQSVTTAMLAAPTEQQIALMRDLVSANQALSIQHLAHRLGSHDGGKSKSTLVMSLIAKAVQEGKCEIITAKSLGAEWIEVDGQLVPYVIRWKKNATQPQGAQTPNLPE